MVISILYHNALCLLNILVILWEFHRMYFDHIYFPNLLPALSRSTSISLFSPTLCPLLFFKYSNKSSLCCSYIPGCEAIPGMFVWYLSDVTLVRSNFGGKKKFISSYTFQSIIKKSQSKNSAVAQKRNHRGMLLMDLLSCATLDHQPRGHNAHQRSGTFPHQ